jgi:NADPH:quinone reductase-like Zn-dependent oxidoreductase
MISGLGWLTFFVPPVAAALLPNNLIIGLSGEAVIILWLLARGVNASQSGSVIATTTGSIPPSSAIFGPWDDLLMLMKAVVCTGYGPPDVLQMGEVARPLPRKREVCIRIFTTAVTASDCIIRDGFRLNFPYRVVGRLAIGVTAPRQPILGMVLAGAIESVGSGVTRFRPGDRVFGMGGFHFGCYAEFVCWPEDAVLAVLPSNLKYEEAAAIPYGGLTARALSDARRRPSRPPNADLRRLGSDWHIGGAVSPPYRGRDHRRVQLFETELVRCHGATAVIDYTRENFADREERYDVIFDAVGKRKSRDAMLHSANALAPNGKRISVDDGMPRLRRAALLELRQVCESGVLRPVIDGCYRLEEIVEAHRYVDQGHKRGNVVVTVS